MAKKLPNYSSGQTKCSRKKWGVNGYLTNIIM